MNKNISSKSTPKELNKAVKELNSELYRMSFQSQSEYFHFVENEAKEQFIRIDDALSDFEELTKRNILVMLRLNLQHRFIAFHSFGLKIRLFLD